MVGRRPRWPTRTHARISPSRIAAAISPFSAADAIPHALLVGRRRKASPSGSSARTAPASPGYDVRCPSSLSEEIRKAFLAAGAHDASLADLESLRIQAGIPRWGFELTEAVLPDEAGLRERGFISDTKGCYVGQETVARIKTYGHVNRNLVRLLLDGEAPHPAVRSSSKARRRVP